MGLFTLQNCCFHVYWNIQSQLEPFYSRDVWSFQCNKKLTQQKLNTVGQCIKLRNVKTTFKQSFVYFIFSGSFYLAKLLCLMFIGIFKVNLSLSIPEMYDPYSVIQWIPEIWIHCNWVFYNVGILNIFRIKCRGKTSLIY